MHKKALTVAIAGALVAPMVAQAANVTVSGHVNRAMQVGDDGEVKFGDGSTSGTRFRIDASGEAMDELEAGVRIEFGVDDDGVNQRHRYVWIRSGFGEVKIGHTSEAADYVAYKDKSGVYVGHGRQGALATYTHGGSRKDGVHYSSPSLGSDSGGGKVLVSAANGNRYSATLEVGGDMNGISFGGAVGYLDANDADAPNSAIGGAFGIKLSGGITASVSAGNISYDDDSAGKDYAQAVLGYVFGDSAVAVAIYDADPDVQVVGVGLTHNIPKPGIQLYATAHDNSEGDANDTVFVVGTKVSF